MPRNRKERAVYRVECLLDWKYGEKAAHRAFAEMIVADLMDSDAMVFPLPVTPAEQS